MVDDLCIVILLHFCSSLCCRGVRPVAGPAAGPADAASGNAPGDVFFIATSAIAFAVPLPLLVVLVVVMLVLAANDSDFFVVADVAVVDDGPSDCR